MEAFKHYPYQIALVALDLTDMDDHMIRYAAMINKALNLERIFFMHVARELELPKDLTDKYPTLMAPLDESIQAEIEQKVDKYFKDSNTRIECVVKDGTPVDKLLKFAKVKHVDLIMMGRKRSLEGSGLVSSHIARKCPSSLLLVTENFNSEIKKVLVPVDYSRHASLAVEQAGSLVKDPVREIELVHFYSVPSGHYKIGKSHEEFSEIIKGHAVDDCARFLKKNRLPADIPCTYILENSVRKEEMLHTHAIEVNADLIVIGSKGRTGASAILMGSFAERLVFQESDVPVLIVKNKGENMGFLETILRI